MIIHLKNVWREIRDRRQLRKCVLETNPSFSLQPIDSSELSTLLNNSSSHEAWQVCQEELSALRIPEASGGVNAGDQRALFSLVYQLRPKRILEIGTHIGASTVHIAAAMNAAKIQGDEKRLTTVDIVDVNSAEVRQWTRFGAPRSPLENLKVLGLDEMVQFVVSDSADFLRKDNHRYDFIFLDGDHSARTVFTELPLALSLLAPGGSILLHDYFPNNQALWSDGARIPGPWIATQSLKKKLDFNVLPLGNLPWATKYNSNITSLALVVA